MRLSFRIAAIVPVLLLAACSTAGPPKPNVIFILADDLGYGDLGAYGQETIRTPNLDQLAAEGMRFTQHYAGSTVCAPSRASLMTGLHTGHTRIRGNYEVRPMGQYPLADQDVTVAEVMKQAGYTTALIGKWGLGYPGSTGIPTKQGFDYFFGYLGQRHAHNYYPEFLFRGEERVPLPGNRIADPRPDGAGVAVDRAIYSPDLLLEEALDFIDRSHGGPFFLMLTMTLPHANNEAGREGMEIPNLGEYADTDWPAPEKRFAAMVSRMDAQVGAVMEKLKSLGIEDDSVVLFSSDNGPHREGGNDPDFFDSNGPLRGIKRDLYEGGIRVPLIVRWPGHVAAGTTSDHVSAFWDVMPTLADMAGAEAPAGIDGLSFLPTLVGDPARQTEQPYLYWEFHEQGGRQAIRMGRWKAVRLNVSEHPDAPVALYDLGTDPGEQTDIAGAHPEIVATMDSLFVAARTENDVFHLFR